MTYESTEIWIANMSLKEGILHQIPETYNIVLHRTRVWVLIRVKDPRHNLAPTGTPCMCLPIKRDKYPISHRGRIYKNLVVLIDLPVITVLFLRPQ